MGIHNQKDVKSGGESSSPLTESPPPETIPAPYFPALHRLNGFAMPRLNLSPLRATYFLFLLTSMTACGSGCRSPYYADRGAGLGALAGAGAGAIIGDATGGNAGTGALIGAGLGTITGAAVGDAMDEMQAQNRAEIAAQLGRQVQSGAATTQEVVAMTQAGVNPQLISNYVRTSGLARPLTANDVIYLHNQGVATEVIDVMQNPPVPAAVAQVPPPPVVVQEHYYGAPYCRPHFGYYHHPRQRPRTSFGFSVVK